MPKFKNNPSPFMMKNSALHSSAKYGSPMQANYNKPSPVKAWPVIAKIGAWLAKGAAKAGVSKAALAAGKKAIVSGATSVATSKLMSGYKKNNSTEIISGKQTKIMEDDKENV